MKKNGYKKYMKNLTTKNITMNLNELERTTLIEHLYKWLDNNDQDEILRDVLIKTENYAN